MGRGTYTGSVYTINQLYNTKRGSINKKVMIITADECMCILPEYMTEDLNVGVGSSNNHK